MKLGLSLMPTPDFLLATLPLFEGGEVDVLEWSVDLGFDGPLPDWTDALLDDYGEAGALFAHGVAYSALSARWEPRQERWLASLREALAKRPYRWCSEHFGFMTAAGFAYGAPMPVPYTETALEAGVDRLRRLREETGLEVGLENLALAFGDADVEAQGPFLEALLAPVDGFLLLDLHNLFTQATNFARDPLELLETYPLARVRELHVSGGRFAEHGGVRVRQDTHDDLVPDEVLELLPLALARCPHVEHVIYERLGGTIASPADLAGDYRRVREALASTPAERPSASARGKSARTVAAGSAPTERLAAYQSALLDALDRGEGIETVRAAFPELATYLAGARPEMIALAGHLTRKWAIRKPNGSIEERDRRSDP